MAEGLELFSWHRNSAYPTLCCKGTSSGPLSQTLHLLADFPAFLPQNVDRCELLCQLSFQSMSWPSPTGGSKPNFCTTVLYITAPSEPLAAIEGSNF